MAADLNLTYELREMKLEEMFVALESGQADVAVAAITMTHDREERVDFSHPYFTSRLGIAVNPGTERKNWFRVLGRILSAASRILGVAKKSPGDATVRGRESFSAISR